MFTLRVSLFLALVESSLLYFYRMSNLVQTQFETCEALEVHAKAVANEAGYVLTRRRTRADRNGNQISIELKCDLGGTYENRLDLTDDTRIRQSGSRLNGCPFKAFGRKRSGAWFLSFGEEHSHPPSDDLRGHAAARRLTPSGRETVNRMTEAGSTPRSIINYLQAGTGTCNSLSRNVYNQRQAWRQGVLAGRAPLEALVDDLQNSEYQFRYHLDCRQRISRLLWIHPKSVNLLHCFPHVLLMDCTYKTNKFKMPLLSIIGITATHRSFFGCFAFLQDETMEGYRWVLERLREICSNLKPGSIVTDRELALMDAISAVFPESKHLLCRWHISKNILAKCKPAFREEEQWAEFSRSWSKLMASNTNEKCDALWTEIRTTYAGQANVIRYLESTWWPHRTHFISAWTDRAVHLNTVVTSRIEGSHAILKRWLGSSTADLFHVVTRISQGIQSQEAHIFAEIQDQQQRVPHRYKIDLFSELIGKVSNHALNFLCMNVEKATLHMNSLSRFEDNDSNAMGLPDVETIKMHILEGQPISLDSIHPHWLLRNRHNPSIEAQSPVEGHHVTVVQMREPRVQRTRGRPAGSLNRRNTLGSTRRNPSEFEHVERAAAAGGRACSLCHSAGHNRRTCLLRFNALIS